MTLVMKFGGTSVGSADAMRKTTDLILSSREQHGNVVVVASGMGSKPIKVTDLLLNGALGTADGDNEIYKTNATMMREIHQATIKALLTKEQDDIIALNNAQIDRYEDLCRAVNVLGELSPRALDAIGGMGEQMSVPILAAYLRELGYDAEAIDATELVVTDSNFLNATPDLAKTKAKAAARLLPILERGGIPVITGFIGADENGVTTTLGRGGSDYSGSIMGYAVDADEVWIWTDVDGIMSTDPRVVDNAVSIPELTYREVSELAYYGAKVLHPKTMRPVIENGIPLRIKNTFNPSHDGTVVVKERNTTDGAIKAVTAIKDLRLLTIEGKGMIGVPGVAARVFGAVAKEDVSILLITQASSEQAICFVTPAGASDAIIAGIESEFADEIKHRDIDRVRVQRPVAIVTVVGSGMRGVPGVSGRVFTALSSVNVLAIAQGSSECSISAVVAEEDAMKAVKLLHALIV